MTKRLQIAKSPIRLKEGGASVEAAIGVMTSRFRGEPRPECVRHWARTLAERHYIPSLEPLGFTGYCYKTPCVPED